MVYRIPGRLCLIEFDEDEMEEAFSMKFIRAIAEGHNLIQGSPRLRSIDELMNEYLRYALEGKLELFGIRS